jgi:hypothetical protein
MIATYAWVSGGELPSQRLRSYTFRFTDAIGILGAVSDDRASKFCHVSSVIAAGFILFYLQEVEGRTVEEIDERVSVRIAVDVKRLCIMRYNLRNDFLRDHSHTDVFVLIYLIYRRTNKARIARLRIQKKDLW